MKAIKLIASLFVSAIFSVSTMADVVTVLEFENITSKDEQLIGGANVTGIISPLPPFILAANSSTSHVSSTPGVLADAGIVQYGGCRFNWSSILIRGAYRFSRGAEPSSRCSVLVVRQNPFTGEHSLKFQINSRF